MYRHKSSGNKITNEVYSELNPKIRARYVQMTKDEVKTNEKVEKEAAKQAAKDEKSAAKSTPKPESSTSDSSEKDENTGGGDDGK